MDPQSDKTTPKKGKMSTADKLALFQTEFDKATATLERYRTLFEADGIIDSNERQQLDQLKGRLAQAQAKLEALRQRQSKKQELQQQNPKGEPTPEGVTKQKPEGFDNSSTKEEDQNNSKENREEDNRAPSTGGLAGFTDHFYDGKVGKEYKLVLCLDQPGSGGDRDRVEMSDGVFDTGHAFIKFIKKNVDGTTEEASIGFYPAGNISPVQHESPGKLQKDDFTSIEIKAEKIVSHTQFFSALRYVYAFSVTTYHLIKYNCTNFAIGVAAAAGWSISLPGGNVVNSNDRGLNPGTLGEDLVETGEGTRGKNDSKSKENKEEDQDKKETGQEETDEDLISTTVTPPEDEGVPKRTVGGSSRMVEEIDEDLVSTTFTPPEDNPAPRQGTGAGSRFMEDNSEDLISTTFTPPEDNPAPRQTVSGSSRMMEEIDEQFVGFTPPDDNPFPQGGTGSGGSRMTPEQRDTFAQDRSRMMEELNALLA